MINEENHKRILEIGMMRKSRHKEVISPVPKLGFREPRGLGSGFPAENPEQRTATEIPQVGTAGFNSLKKAKKVRFLPTTAIYRHFFGMESRQEPTVLMEILPQGFWVNVLVGNGLDV